MNDHVIHAVKDRLERAKREVERHAKWAEEAEANWKAVASALEEAQQEVAALEEWVNAAQT